jgi:hypothetical protein
MHWNTKYLETLKRERGTKKHQRERREKKKGKKKRIVLEIETNKKKTMSSRKGPGGRHAAVGVQKPEVRTRTFVEATLPVSLFLGIY